MGKKPIMELFFVFVILVSHANINGGQNVPEGIIITTTTKMPTTTEATTTKTITTETTTMMTTTRKKSTTGTPTTKVDLTTTAPTTTEQKTRKVKDKKDSGKKKNKAAKSPAKSDLKLTEIDHNIKESKKKLKALKDKKREAKRDKKKLKKDEKKKKKELKKAKKKEVKKAKKIEKSVRKELKILFKQEKARLKQMKKESKKKFKLTDRKYMKEFLRNCTLLFKSVRRERKEQRKRKKDHAFSNQTIVYETPPNGFEIVKTMNDFGNNLASMLKQERLKKKKRREIMPVSSDGIEMEVSVFSTEGFKGYKFPDPTSKLNVSDTIRLPAGIFKNAKGNGTIISIVYDSFYEMTMEGNNSKKGFVNSKVVSATVDPRPTTELSDPVEITLSHLQKPNTTKPDCVFWKVNESNLESSHWSSEGCKVFTSNQTHTVCHCNHLTDFAVLFRVSETKKALTPEHKQALTIISLVGCLLSAVCLMVTVLVFIVLRKLLHSTRNLIHLNLAVALLVANILFLLSGRAFPDKDACLAITVCLHYFFLSAFCWMLGEGVYIWIMVAKAFSENLKAWMYLAIGWGIPLVIVGISVGAFRYNLVAADFCWLSIKSGAIWTFVGPALFIITVNFGILIKVLCTAIQHQSSDGGFKVSARLTLLLLPILGLTWLFGVLSMNNETVVFEYLFTLFNSSQGIFILLCYIALNSEVKNEYGKWRAKKEYAQSLPMKTTTTSSGSGDRRSRSGTQNETAQMIA